MKIGIITICKVNNYGAELQAFATQKKLEQMGFETEIIDYIYYKNWRFRDTHKSAPFIALSLKEKIMYWIKYRFINRLGETVLPTISSSNRKRRKNYLDFFKLEKFSPSYYSMDELYANYPKYDVYVVGSDQVWNPSASSSIEPYFLTFASKGSKKIAYASSFGVSEINPALQNRYRELLNNINFISVREKNGVDLVRQLTGKVAKHVVDPTLLLNKEQWSPFMKPIESIASKYILIYELLPSEHLVRLARKFADKLQIPIYCLCKRGYAITHHQGTSNLVEAGPSEFIWLIAHATYVITNSFHGTAFSVNFGTPFYSVLNKQRKNNSRITSLLSSIGLENRIIYEDEIEKLEIDYSGRPIDNAQLAKLVADSEEYLRTALKI